MGKNHTSMIFPPWAAAGFYRQLGLALWACALVRAAAAPRAGRVSFGSARTWPTSLQRAAASQQQKPSWCVRVRARKRHDLATGEPIRGFFALFPPTYMMNNHNIRTVADDALGRLISQLLHISDNWPCTARLFHPPSGVEADRQRKHE